MKLGVSYFGNRSPRHVAKDMEDIARNNCNFVVHTFSENDLKFYKKSMKQIVEISHQNGLEVYLDPWGIGNIFGGEAFSEFIIQNPDSWQVLSNKQKIPLACLNNEKFRKFIKDWVTTACAIGSDVIFWDEPHMFLEKQKNNKSVFSCCCPTCQTRFKGRFARQMPDELTPEVNLFIGETITNFLKEVSHIAKKNKVKNAVCVYAKEEYELFWDMIAGIKYIDIFGSDPYWRFAKAELRPFVTYFSQKVVQTAKKYKKEGQIWIQAMRIPSGCEAEIETAVDIAFNEGIRNIAAWSYHGGGLMDTLSSKNPQLVWQTLSAAYGKILNSS